QGEHGREHLPARLGARGAAALAAAALAAVVVTAAGSERGGGTELAAAAGGQPTGSCRYGARRCSTGAEAALRGPGTARDDARARDDRPPRAPLRPRPRTPDSVEGRAQPDRHPVTAPARAPPGGRTRRGLDQPRPPVKSRCGRVALSTR